MDIDRIKNIHALSVIFNKGQDHREKLISMIKEHVVEIQQLIESNDKHYISETADLMILCAEVIIDAQHDVNQALSVRYQRFEDKLQTKETEEM